MDFGIALVPGDKTKISPSTTSAFEGKTTDEENSMSDKNKNHVQDDSASFSMSELELVSNSSCFDYETRSQNSIFSEEQNMSTLDLDPPTSCLHDVLNTPTPDLDQAICGSQKVLLNLSMSAVVPPYNESHGDLTMPLSGVELSNCTSNSFSELKTPIPELVASTCTSSLHNHDDSHSSTPHTSGSDKKLKPLTPNLTAPSTNNVHVPLNDHSPTSGRTCQSKTNRLSNESMDIDNDNNLPFSVENTSCAVIANKDNHNCMENENINTGQDRRQTKVGRRKQVFTCTREDRNGQEITDNVSKPTMSSESTQCGDLARSSSSDEEMENCQESLLLSVEEAQDDGTHGHDNDVHVTDDSSDDTDDEEKDITYEPSSSEELEDDSDENMMETTDKPDEIEKSTGQKSQVNNSQKSDISGNLYPGNPMASEVQAINQDSFDGIIIDSVQCILDEDFEKQRDDSILSGNHGDVGSKVGDDTFTGVRKVLVTKSEAACDGNKNSSACIQIQKDNNLSKHEKPRAIDKMVMPEENRHSDKELPSDNLSFVCWMCDTSYRSLTDLKTHVLSCTCRSNDNGKKVDIHENLSKIKNHFDNWKVKQQSSACQNKLPKQKNGVWNCKHCSGEYESKQSLASHLKHCKKDFKYRFTHEGMETYPNAKTKSQSKFACSECSFSCQTHKLFRRHLNSKHAKFLCRYCPKKFFLIKKYSQHIMIHLGDLISQKGKTNYYLCSSCDITIKNNTAGVKHLMCHITEEETLLAEHIASNECPQCGIPFLDYSNMVSHSKTHKESSDSILTCNYCIKEFQNHNDFDLHLVGHCRDLSLTKNNLLYNCSVCGKTFENSVKGLEHVYAHFHWRTSLVDHLATNECSICKCPFLGPANLKSHTMEHQRNQEPKELVINEEDDRERKIRQTHKLLEGMCCSLEPTGGSEVHVIPNDDDSGVKISINMTREELENVLKLQYICGICGTRFPEEKYLQHHMFIHVKNDNAVKETSMPSTCTCVTSSNSIFTSTISIAQKVPENKSQLNFPEPSPLRSQEKIEMTSLGKIKSVTEPEPPKPPCTYSSMLTQLQQRAIKDSIAKLKSQGKLQNTSGSIHVVLQKGVETEKLTNGNKSIPSVPNSLFSLLPQVQQAQPSFVNTPFIHQGTSLIGTNQSNLFQNSIGISLPAPQANFNSTNPSQNVVPMQADNKNWLTQNQVLTIPPKTANESDLKILNVQSLVSSPKISLLGASMSYCLPALAPKIVSIGSQAVLQTAPLNTCPPAASGFTPTTWGSPPVPKKTSGKSLLPLPVYVGLQGMLPDSSQATPLQTSKTAVHVFQTADPNLKYTSTDHKNFSLHHSVLPSDSDKNGADKKINTEIQYQQFADPCRKLNPGIQNKIKDVLVKKFKCSVSKKSTQSPSMVESVNSVIHVEGGRGMKRKCTEICKNYKEDTDDEDEDDDYDDPDDNTLHKDEDDEDYNAAEFCDSSGSDSDFASDQ